MSSITKARPSEVRAGTAVAFAVPKPPAKTTYARGIVERLSEEGEVKIRGTSEVVEAKPNDPVAVVRVYAQQGRDFVRTDRQVAKPVSQLRVIDDIEKQKKRNKSVADTLRDKVKDHNEQYGDEAGKSTSLSTLQAVFDRGIGAYRTNPSSVRPNVTSAEQWAYGRVNGFLYALRTGRFRRTPYDTDLLPKQHPKSTKKSVMKATSFLIIKHYPGGQDHDQMRHGDWADGWQRTSFNEKLGVDTFWKSGLIDAIKKDPEEFKKMKEWISKEAKQDYESMPDESGLNPMGVMVPGKNYAEGLYAEEVMGEFYERKGLRVQVTVELGKTATEHDGKVKKVLDTFSDLEARTPKGKDITVRVTTQLPQTTSPIKSPAVAELGGTKIFLSPDAITPPKSLVNESTRVLMKSYPKDPARYAMAHEYGHLLDEDKSARELTESRAFELEGRLSFYGRENVMEAYAEAYAEWFMTDGDSPNLFVKEMAKRFAWDKGKTTKSLALTADNEFVIETFSTKTRPRIVRGEDLKYAETVAKHYPGGTDHNQLLHGNWARGNYQAVSANKLPEEELDAYREAFPGIDEDERAYSLNGYISEEYENINGYLRFGEPQQPDKEPPNMSQLHNFVVLDDKFSEALESDMKEEEEAFGPMSEEDKKVFTNEFIEQNLDEITEAYESIEEDEEMAPYAQYVIDDADNIDNLIYEAPRLFADKTLYRVYSERVVGALKQGDILTDNGFTSTTYKDLTSPEFAQERSDLGYISPSKDVVAVILPNPSQPGRGISVQHMAAIGAFTMSNVIESEAEVILPAGSSFEVIGRRTSNNQEVLVLRRRN